MQTFPAPGGYVQSEHGLFWACRTPFYKALLPVTGKFQPEHPLTRRTVPTQPIFQLQVPKIPIALLEMAVGFFRFVLQTAGGQAEAVIYLCFEDGAWSCNVPTQRITPLTVQHQPISALDHVAVVVHSHGKMPAYFSTMDDASEDDGFIFGVIGNLDKPDPACAFRVGDRGYFLPLHFWDLWDNTQGRN